MKISVIMSIYDRNVQLLNTLASYAAFPPSHAEVEIILIEDAKNAANEEWHTFLLATAKEHGLVLLNDPYDGDYNPCRKLNYGISQSTGDVVLLTNPENMHVGWLFKDIEYNLYFSPRMWCVWACEHESGWHQHSVHAPHGWHYCAAGTRKVWDEIGGFDERYAAGISWEDNDLVRTIQKLNIPIKQIDVPHTFHQKHSHTWGLTEDKIQAKIRTNQDLYSAKWGDDKITVLGEV